jgi:hypothetical protein
MPDWVYNLNLQDEKIRTSTEIKELEAATQQGDAICCNAQAELYTWCRE